MHGPANHLAVAVHVTDNLVFFEEGELPLTAGLVGSPLEQFADRPQAVQLVTAGNLAGPVDLPGVVLMNQRLQSDQHTQPRHAALLQHVPPPARGRWADPGGLFQQGLRAQFDL